jgi:hypothetical protein
MRTIRAYDIFFSRLKLLVVMAGAYLKGQDCRMWRLRSMRRNTKYMSLFMRNWNDHLTNFISDSESRHQIQLDHIFYQRVKLLSIMIKSFAEGNPMGLHRKLALKNNVDYLNDILEHMQCIQRPRLVVIK